VAGSSTALILDLDDRVSRINRAHPLELSERLGGKKRGMAQQLKIHKDEPVRNFVQRAVLVAETEPIEEAAKAMTAASSGCAVVVTKGNKPIGIVTEWDILARVVAKGRDVKLTRVREVMSSPIITIHPDEKVGSAISLMLERGFRRLIVEREKEAAVLGVITLAQVVGNRQDDALPLPLLEPSTGSRCPYCGSILKDREELSKHIDDVHIREEILKSVSPQSSY
jgi:CBS domain-containing protein